MWKYPEYNSNWISNLFLFVLLLSRNEMPSICFPYDWIMEMHKIFSSLSRWNPCYANILKCSLCWSHTVHILFNWGITKQLCSLCLKNSWRNFMPIRFNHFFAILQLKLWAEVSCIKLFWLFLQCINLTTNTECLSFLSCLTRNVCKTYIRRYQRLR